MPTSRPRHTLTETDELRDVLDRAQPHFPHASTRKALLEELVRLGDDVLRARAVDEERRAQQRHAQIEYLVDVSTGRRDGFDRSVLHRVRTDAYRH